MTADALQYFDSAGVRIRYTERGRGPPVVLVHSYAGDLEDQWIKTGVLSELAGFYRVIAFDVRGHGGSDKPHDPQAYGPTMAWDIVRLLDHLALEKAHVIGYSMGAHIVAQLLTMAPHRLVSATLGGASGRRNWTPEHDRQAEKEAKEMEQGLLTSQLMRLWPSDQPRPDTAQLKAMSAQFLSGKDRYALAAIRRSNKAQVVTTEQIAAARVPLLGIVGSADPYRCDFDELRKLVRELTLIVLDGATHLSAPVHPEFIPAILNFLHAHTLRKDPA